MTSTALPRFVVAALMLCLCGCRDVRETLSAQNLDASRKEARAGIDESACRAAGGHIGSIGMFGLPACVRPLADGGKHCTDKADCEGRCLGTGPAVSAGTPMTGACQRQEPLDGCWQEVAGGRAMQAWCAE